MHHARRFLIGACVLALGPCLAEGAVARVTCSYAGPPANRLTIKATGGSEPVISRNGDEIRVNDYGKRPTTCAGDTATVLNTDTVEVDASEYADLNLAGGLLAPGATLETDGASEIEVEITGHDEVDFAVNGTTAADEYHWVQVLANAALNVNPGAGDTDADVTVFGTEDFIVANGRAGNDTIIPEPGARFNGDGVFSTGGTGNDLLVAPAVAGGILWGGAGADVLTGSNTFDILRGGAGRDRIDGGGDGDLIYPGSGSDVVLGGLGSDTISARDRTTDSVDCGPGHDVVRADKGDQLRGCEKVGRP
jgi:Ca2+-binding RTX toxin-like protein